MKQTTDSETMNGVLGDLLANLGFESVSDMELGEAYHIDMEDTPFMDLHVEKTRPDRLSVTHYVESRGDLCRDPEVVFKQDGEQFIPVEFQLDNLLGGKYEHDENGIEGMGEYLDSWGRNLQTQGHVEAATTATHVGGE